MRTLLLLIALLIGFHSVAVADTFEETRAKAEQGDAEAQHSLGTMYEYGLGVPQDHAEAMKWHRSGGQGTL
jgi:TPR repeat protein